METEVKILFPEKSTAGYNDHWKRTEQEFFLKGFARAMKDNEKAVNMHEELIECIKNILTEVSPLFNFDLRKSTEPFQKAQELIKQAEGK